MSLFKVTSSPHIRHEDTTSSIMRDVIIALLPMLVFGVFMFGYRVLFLTAVSVLSCVLSEGIYNKLMKKASALKDLSAVVSGILLAYNLPVTAPVWLAVVGGVFAMIVVKGLFGGIGKNIVNPVLAARVFLFSSWPTYMGAGAFLDTQTKINSFSFGAAASSPDAISGATALAELKNGTIPQISLADLIVGKTPGCIGEVSSTLIICAGFYLLVRRVITWHIPVSFVSTVAILSFLLAPSTVSSSQFMLYEIFSGGLILGAVFMATDYVTSPVTKGGKIIFGIGCGLITVFIRLFGGYSEGVSFAILIMNLFVWYLDRAFKPKKFGGGKKSAKI